MFTYQYKPEWQGTVSAAPAGEAGSHITLRAVPSPMTAVLTRGPLLLLLAWPIVVALRGRSPLAPLALIPVALIVWSAMQSAQRAIAHPERDALLQIVTRAVHGATVIPVRADA
jgi:hypothetical protein